MDIYRNRFDTTGKCSQEGNSAENAFKKVLKKRGDVKESSERDNKFLHFDLVQSVDGKKVKYDVKARKRVSRNDSEPTDEVIWIEWLNVNGNKGWIDGKADFIVFEQENSFIIIKREKLKALCEKLCDMNNLVSSASEALYRCYQRRGRNDLISLIKTSDVLKEADEVVSK